MSQQRISRPQYASARRRASGLYPLGMSPKLATLVACAAFRAVFLGGEVPPPARVTAGLAAHATGVAHWPGCRRHLRNARQPWPDRAPADIGRRV